MSICNLSIILFWSQLWGACTDISHPAETESFRAEVRTGPRNCQQAGRAPGPSPADTVEAVAFVASDRAAFITGELLNVAGGAYMRS
jgi:NAD(P)-dependent dehydrogenase (short-subunit alcohol dehydrogenase family)